MNARHTININQKEEETMLRVKRVSGWGLAGLLLAVAGCAYDGGMTQKSAMTPTLYERLGSKEAITAVVDDFVGRVAADSRINGKFATADIPRLKRLLVEQICTAAGGHCTYTGRDMKTAHAGMGITGPQFEDRKSTRLNSSHLVISYAVFCLKKKKK